MHEVLVNRLGGLSLPRKSVVRLTDRPDMTLDVYRGRKTTIQQQMLFTIYFEINYMQQQCVTVSFMQPLLENANFRSPPPPPPPLVIFIAGRPKAALLFWFFGDFRCGALLFMVIHVIYKYKNT